MEKYVSNNNQDPLVSEGGLDVNYLQGPVKTRAFSDPLCMVLYLCGTIAAIVMWIVAASAEDYSQTPDLQMDQMFGVYSQEEQPQNLNDSQKSATIGAAAIVFCSTLVFSVGIVYLTPSLADCIVWFMIFLQMAALFGAGAFWLMNPLGGEGSAIGGIFIALGCIYLIIIFCLRERIRRAVVLIKAASQFLIDHKISLLIPTIAFILYISLSVMYFSMGVKFNNKKNYQAISKNQYDASMGIGAFMYVWTSVLIQFLAVLQLCIFICQWYFSYNRTGSRTEPESPFFKSFVWPLRYHLGSLCFGSLIITIVTIIRSVVQNKSKRSSGCIDCLISSISKCIEDLLKHLTKMALIMMAMSGQSFCGSAREGLVQVLNHFGDYAVLQPLAEYYANFGVFFISCASTLFGFLLMSSADGGIVQSQWIYIMVFFVVSIVISSTFMNIITMAANCCLFYNTVDKQINKGVAVHGPPIMQDFDEVAKKQQDI